jgi:hypothetical protein
MKVSDAIGCAKLGGNWADYRFLSFDAKFVSTQVMHIKSL